MIRALLYYRSRSLRNRIVASARRLRQPKYLLSFLVGAAYIYFIFLRRFHLADAAGRSYRQYGINPAAAQAMMTSVPAATVATLGGAILFIFLFVSALFAWNSATAAARLKFSEAEIAFLFPAPLSRQRLIHFNLLGTQFSILISSLILTLILNRWSFLGGNALTHAIGWWLILSTVTLWGNAMNFLAARAIEAFGPAVRRRVLMLLVVAGVLLVRAVWQAAHPPMGLDPAALPASMLGYLADWVRAAWGRVLLFPFASVILPFAAASVPAFLRAMPAALGVPVACYCIIAFMEVPFREGSILSAGKWAQARAIRRETGTSASARALRARRAPFRLEGPGRPELAFFWKNLIGIQSWFNLRIVISLLLLTTMVVTNVTRGGAHRAGSPYALVVLSLAAFAGFYIMLLGPQLLRQDLRSDLLHADVLKIYPLRGWQIVTGEMLTPAVIMSGMLWITALAAGWAIFSGFPPAERFSYGARAALLLCVAAVIPPVVFLQLVIPNAAALMFPAWHQTVRSRSGGIEVIGQRLIFTFGQFVAVILALLPAALTGVVMLAATWGLLNLLRLPAQACSAGALILATLSVVGVVAGEVCVGLWWLGERFERLDIATEIKP